MKSKAPILIAHNSALASILDNVGNSYAMHPAEALAGLPDDVAKRFAVHDGQFSSLHFLRGACRDLRVKAKVRESGQGEAEDRTAALRAWLVANTPAPSSTPVLGRVKAHKPRGADWPTPPRPVQVRPSGSSSA